MAKSSTSFKKGENTKRGKSFKNKLLDAIHESEELQSLLKTETAKGDEDERRNSYEKAFITEMSRRAFTEGFDGASTLLSHILNKTYPSLKQVAPDIVIQNFPHDGTPTEKANAVMNAIAEGEIPPDIGATIIGAAKDTIVIEETTDLKRRMEEIEKKLGLNL